MRKGKQPVLSFSKVLEINSALDYYYRNYGNIISGEKMILLYEELVGKEIQHGYEKTKHYKIFIKGKSVFTIEERILPPNAVSLGLPTLQEANGATLDPQRSPDAE